VEWYWLGVMLGLGVAIGVLAAALLAGLRAGIAVSVVVGAAAGLVVGAVFGWDYAAVAAVGGVVGAASAGFVVRGALSRGGTRAATGLLVGGAALAVAALAFVPLLGYLEAVALPLLARRARTRAVERYAGLRSLAR
jgi:hypothetical protein